MRKTSMKMGRGVHGLSESSTMDLYLQRLLGRPLALIRLATPPTRPTWIGAIALDLPPLALGAAERLASPLFLRLAAVSGLTHVGPAYGVHVLRAVPVELFVFMLVSMLLLLTRMRCVHG